MKTIEFKSGNDNNSYFVREAFNTLRTNILFCEKNVKTILVTSVQAHEGKTTIALELAKYLAQASKKVLLVDADLRMSILASKYTNARGVMGLSQVLSGQATVEDAICATQVKGLDILLAGPYPPNPVDLLDGDTFKDLVKDKREEYDYVLIDSPPLGIVVDAAVIGSVCDGAVLVISTGLVKYRHAQDVKDQLEKSGCKILGAVLNSVSRKTKIETPKYSKYYYYYSHNAQKGSKNPLNGLIKRKKKD